VRLKTAKTNIRKYPKIKLHVTIAQRDLIMSYAGPVKSMHYLLRHAVDIDKLLAKEAHAEVNHELIGDILSGAASFSEDVLAPINLKRRIRPLLKAVGKLCLYQQSRVVWACPQWSVWRRMK